MKKLGLSQVVGVVLLVALSLVVISVVWIAVQNQISFSPTIECSPIGVKNHIFLRNACYLNDDEISVKLERDLNSIDFDSMDFIFTDPFEMEFILTGGKCLDVRDSSSEYGKECSLLNAGQIKSYVFNVTGEQRINKFSFGISSRGSEVCIINQIDVKEQC